MSTEEKLAAALLEIQALRDALGETVLNMEYLAGHVEHCRGARSHMDAIESSEEQ